MEAVDVRDSKIWGHGGGYLINCPIDDIYSCVQIYGSEAISYTNDCKLHYKVTCKKVEGKTISSESLLTSSNAGGSLESHGKVCYIF